MHAVINPATEEIVANVAATSADEADQAIARANAAFESWRGVAPGDRANLLRRFSDVVREHAEELARQQ